MLLTGVLHTEEMITFEIKSLVQKAVSEMAQQVKTLSVKGGNLGFILITEMIKGEYWFLKYFP